MFPENIDINGIPVNNNGLHSWSQLQEKVFRINKIITFYSKIIEEEIAKTGCPNRYHSLSITRIFFSHHSQVQVLIQISTLAKSTGQNGFVKNFQLALRRSVKWRKVNSNLTLNF